MVKSRLELKIGTPKHPQKFQLKHKHNESNKNLLAEVNSDYQFTIGIQRITGAASQLY